ncbi:MAG: endo-1,4-beta-xylanase [bacterium]|nr:endo-1,4-beta-xylanase [bacterium]
MMKKIKILLLFILGLLIFSFINFRPARDPEWGVNFSIPHARYLGFDPQQMYLDILYELQPKYVRTMAYWEIIEPKQGKFDFSEIDPLVHAASKSNTKLIMVVGLKQPRWPECHRPGWASRQELGIRNQALLDYIKAVVERYKHSDAVYAWQVENEPFFSYGPECGRIERSLFKSEIELVRALDDRPIVVTDSGEKGDWFLTAWAGGDIFGSTMYREVYHHKKGKYIKYQIPAEFYRFKAGLVKTLSSLNEFVGVELQAEPWFTETDVHHTSWEQQSRHMNPEIFQEYVEYAEKAGFAQNYFWGVEWWYWARQQGHPEMWEAGKSIINDN